MIKEFIEQQRATFLDYIFGGTEISVHVAIDYTLSNGPPNEQDSLHYLNPNNFINEYTAAISACLGIIQDYDSD